MSGTREVACNYSPIQGWVEGGWSLRRRATFGPRSQLQHVKHRRTANKCHQCGRTLWPHRGADGARLVIISMQGPARHSHASKPLLHLFSSSPPPPPISPGASCSGGMPWQVLYWHVWPRKAARRSSAAQRPAAVREQQQPLSWIKTLSCWPCPGHTRQTQPEWDVHPVSAECWAGVVDAGPALIRHRVTVHGL